MNIVWRTRSRGRKTTHAEIDGSYRCYFAELPGSEMLNAPLSAAGHPQGRMCTVCENIVKTLGLRIKELVP